MSAVLWIANHWDQLTATVGAVVALSAHIRALVPLPAAFGHVLDALAGNYGRASNRLRD
jgi:hypothetical protein